MVKLLAYIRVIRFEGVPCISNCEIYQDDMLIEKLLPIVSEKRIKLLPEIKYKVVAESENKQFSVSFKSLLFEDDGMFWLPLFESAEDFLSEQPEEVNSPRVLILAHKKLVEEGKSNLVTEESALDYEFMPEIKLDYCENTMIINDDQCIDFSETVSVKESSQLSFEPEEKILFLSKDQETQNSALNPDQSSDKLLEISIYYQESLNNHKKFTENILQEIDNKNRELSEAMNEISELKQQVHKFEVENNYLKTMSNGFIGVQINELVSQLQFYKEKVKEIEKSQNFSPVEEMVRNECEKMGFEPPIRECEEVYVMSGKKINLFVKGGKLYCRTGNGCKEFRQMVMELNSENKPVVSNMSKSPFRKNLGELNASVDTPRGLCKGLDCGKPRKSTPNGSKIVKPQKRNYK